MELIGECMKNILLAGLILVSACGGEHGRQSSLQDVETCGVSSTARKFDRFTRQCLADFNEPSKSLVSRCFKQFNDYYPDMNRRCRALYRSDVRKYFASNLIKFADTIPSFVEPGNVEPLSELLIEWVELKNNLYKSDTAQPIYQKDANNIISGIWSSINKQILKESQETGANNIDRIHENIASLTIERADDKASLDFTLALLAPAFSVIEENIKNLAEAHDLLCDLSNCSIVNRNEIASAVLSIENIVRSRSLNIDSENDPTSRFLASILSKKSLIQDGLRDKSTRLFSFPKDHRFSRNSTNDILARSSAVASAEKNSSFLSLLNSAVLMAGNYRSTARFFW